MSDLYADKINSLCKSLENESKAKRKSTLEQLRKETLENETINIDETFEIIFKNILKCFHDNAEICRDLSIKIIIGFVPKINDINPYLSYILPVILKRIGNDPVVETSEEVRLLLILLLQEIIVKADAAVFPYMNDVSAIITKSLSDSYPTIKIESCNSINKLINVIPTKFHVQCERFINALLPALNHKHYKVRHIVIKTLGNVIQHGTHGFVEKVGYQLAEKLYDSNMNVRKSVVTVAGNWLVDLPDRYSQFARIIPLILTGLADEIEEVRNEANTLWLKAGKQFLDENEEQYKQHEDYLSQTNPMYYPNSYKRPSYGCRALVQREASKLFPAAAAELHDWTIGVQLQSASLICELLLHLEERSIQHVHRFWSDLCLICADPKADPRLLAKVEEIAKLVGNFAELSSLLKIVIPQNQLTIGQLHCLKCLLNGLPVVLEPDLSVLSSALFHTSSTSLQFDYQVYLYECINNLLRATKEGKKLQTTGPCTKSVYYPLFNSILVIQGMENADLFPHLNDALFTLSEISEIEVSNFYSICGGEILNSVRNTAPVWTDNCADKNIFAAFVQGAGTGIGPHLSTVNDIFKTWIEKTITAKCLADLARIARPLLSWKYLCECKVNPEEFLSIFIKDVIIPGLIWHAGRLAEAKRSQALYLLLVIITEPDLPNSLLISFAENLLPLLVSALEETSKSVRLNAAESLFILLPIWAPKLPLINVMKTANVLADRLDDTCSDVRYKSLSALQNLLMAVPNNKEISPSQMESIQKRLLIYLDDSDTKFQNDILDVLKNIGHIATEQLLNLLLRGRKNFNNQEGCDILQNHLASLTH